MSRKVEPRPGAPGALRALAAAASAATAAALGSCNILGPAAYIAAGQPKADAAYVLADRPTVVFVDDRRNAIPLNSLNTRRAIADEVTRQLQERELVLQMIAPQDALALVRQRDRDDELLAIDEVGDGVGAEQVIFVEMLSFEGSTGGMPRLSASCRVKVIDVPNRTRLFPDPASEQDYRDVAVVGPTVSPERFRTEQGLRQLQLELALMVGDQVTRLFYRHVPDEVGQRLGRR